VVVLCQALEVQEIGLVVNLVQSKSFAQGCPTCMTARIDGEKDSLKTIIIQ
jgi:hypothetical protein